MHEICVMPCTVVYLDAEGAGSPNLRHADTFSYVDQAVTLNRSLLAAGLPRLTVATNLADSVNARLSRFDTGADPPLFHFDLPCNYQRRRHSTGRTSSSISWSKWHLR